MTDGPDGPVMSPEQERLFAMLAERLDETEMDLLLTHLVGPAMTAMYESTKARFAYTVSEMVTAIGIPTDDYRLGHLNGLKAALAMFPAQQ